MIFDKQFRAPFGAFCLAIAFIAGWMDVWQRPDANTVPLVVAIIGAVCILRK